jgi:hypothetical protein
MTAACTPSRDVSSSSGSGQVAETGAAGQSTTSSSQGLTIDFRSEPDPPRSGESSIEVDVKQPDGSPVSDATVTAVFSLPAMPSMNMPSMRSDSTLVHEGSGRYRGRAQLSMAGTWNVTVAVSRGPIELGSRKFSIIAK